MSSRMVKFGMVNRLYWEYVFPKFLRVRKSAGCWMRQGNELLGLNGNMWCEELRMSPHVVKFCVEDHIFRIYVVLEFLKARASAGHWRIQGMSSTEPY
jgi:hypothetical protein